MYLHVQRVIAFPIEVALPIPMRLIKQRYKGPINENPPMLPSSA
jgi:hypothetical protein